MPKVVTCDAPGQPMLSDVEEKIDENEKVTWPFETDAGDHFETSAAAYSDAAPLLRFAARQRARRRADHESTVKESSARLRIYDPYFCSGRMTELLGRLGFPRVINRRRDFYQDVADGLVPRYDVLLTNPPYSADHKARLYEYVLGRQRLALESGVPEPFMMLLPSWTVGKATHLKFLRALASINQAQGAVRECGRETHLVFYVCGRGDGGRPAKYTFDHVRGAGLPQAPFFGVWICGGFGDVRATEGAERRTARSWAEGYWEADSSWYACRPRGAAPAGEGAVEVEWTDGTHGAISARELRGGCCVFSSTRELEEAGLLRSAEEVRQRQESNPKQRALREAAQEERKRRRLAAREAEGGKRRRGGDKRQYTSALDVAPGTVEKAGTTSLPKNVCRHFFSELGCSRGEKCRFVHTKA